MTDKNGIVYSYASGNININSPTDTLGSLLQGYTTNGALVFSKRWKIPFYIQKMEYDGNGHFYFAAIFYGTQVIDAITIKSHGNIDGVTGKMDLTGRIIWMKTFGGGKVDQGNSICFNSADSSVYITGNIKDSLFLNNVFVSKNQQSAIVLHYSSSGAYINHKLYDFVPMRDDQGFINSGREICKGLSGNLFVLMDRDGKFWDGIDSVSGPTMGRYIIKLNSDLDTLWSTFIIGPGCYYGWDGNSLKTAANGDAYIASYCSGKYGGTGKLSRLNGSTGQISWNYLNDDGAYTDIYLDGNTVFLTGNEGAIGCPCPEGTSGYFVVKKIDQNNALVGETRFSGVHINYITKDISGNIFVTGDFGQKTVLIGNETLSADSTFNSGSYYYYGRFLTKLSDVNCIAPIISVSVPSIYGHYYAICLGDTARLTVNLTQGTFNWSNGATGTQTDVYSSGLYSVINTQPNGCKAYSLPVDIRVRGGTPGAIFGDTTVCAGSSNRYNISSVDGASSYTWTLPSGWIGSSTSNFINTTASTTSGNITITANTTCGTSAPRTLSVTVNSASPAMPGTIGGNASVCPFSLTTYTVASMLDVISYSWLLPSTWTGSSTTNLISVNTGTIGGNISVTANNACGSSAVQTKSVVVTTIDNTVALTGFTLTANMTGANYQWIDCANNNAIILGATNQNFTPPFSGNYAVIVMKDNCTDTSSCKNVIITGIPDNSETTNLSVFPNPMEDIVYVHYTSTETNGGFQLEIKNILGQVIYASTVSSFQGEYKKTIDLSKEAPGDYFIQIRTENKTIMKKIILY